MEKLTSINATVPIVEVILVKLLCKRSEGDLKPYTMRLIYVNFSILGSTASLTLNCPPSFVLVYILYM